MPCLPDGHGEAYSLHILIQPEVPNNNSRALGENPLTDTVAPSVQLVGRPLQDEELLVAAQMISDALVD